MKGFDNDCIIKRDEFPIKEEIKRKRLIKKFQQNHSSIGLIHCTIISSVNWVSAACIIRLLTPTHIIKRHFCKGNVVTSVELQLGESVLHLGISSSIVISLNVVRIHKLILHDGTGRGNNMGFSIDNDRDHTHISIKPIDSLNPLLPDTITYQNRNYCHQK